MVMMFCTVYRTSCLMMLDAADDASQCIAIETRQLRLCENTRSDENTYRNPASPSTGLPPAAALLLARMNFRSSSSTITIMSAAAAMQVAMPGK